MAVLARRNWSAIRDEVIKRCGNITATGFSGRVEYCVAAAYELLATTYHHFELDVVDSTIVLSTSANSVTLPAKCYVVVGFKLLNAAGTAIVGEVTEMDVRSVLADYKATIAQPKRRGRFGQKLYFDTKPDIAYRSELYYYAYPTAPDFGTPTSPELASDVDEHIIEAACGFVAGAIKDDPFSGLNRMLLSDWLQTQVRNPIVVPLPDMRERRAAEVTMGGSQG